MEKRPNHIAQIISKPIIIQKMPTTNNITIQIRMGRLLMMLSCADNLPQREQPLPQSLLENF